MKRHSRLCLVLVLCSPAPALAADKPAAEGPPTFEEHVRPLLRAHCFECHGEGKNLRRGLDLRLRRLILEGGASGPAVRPGKRDGSILYDMVQRGAMPPGKKKLTKIDLVGRRRAPPAARGARPARGLQAPDRGLVVGPAGRHAAAFPRGKSAEVKVEKVALRGHHLSWVDVELAGSRWP